ncbi:hypothetical protein CVO77_20250 (plasmid) [Sphingopyxis lindanitolerans]|jgi:tellurite resistance-related uncharacterized protein|uniref:Uncharacterized protein n=1 Tax=Sphingopyxis lindanitolerans TaxID=2054227 RepID=A0A2S8B0F9_9SPHN|nr:MULTISPECIES: hypothetical protein [Sphingomonadaceae]PQM25769.1 hypothetical protein CVO77_20250 [Sphingopyxis lindanitolerans]PZU63050.1 MAG: hypothetical protein DI540_25130 [Sphingobium sp.]
MALEPIRVLEFADADRADVQRRVVDAVQAAPERFLTDYAARPGTFGGRYVCADAMKELLPEYTASREARGRYNAPVHNAAAVLAAEQYRRVVADSSDPARNLVLFVTGMPGAGKTSEIQYAALHEGNRLGRDVRAIFEGQLVDPQASIAKVEQALSAGCRVGVIAVLPRPEEALAHTFQRFEELGRGASAAVMVRIQEGTPDGLEALLGRFGDQISVAVHDVRDRANVHRLEGMDGVNIWQKELENGPVQERLEREFDRLNQLGRVSADCALQFKGQSPHGQLYAIGGPDVGGSLAHGDGRKATPESGRTSLLNAARGSSLAGLSDALKTGQSEGDGKTKSNEIGHGLPKPPSPRRSR